MAKSWPDPPPLFELDPEDAGARATWLDAEADDGAIAAPHQIVLVSTSDEERPSEWLERIGVFDLETTGIDVHGDRIVTAYVGLLNHRGEVIHEEHWLADPGIDIPESASEIHGISTEHARAHGRRAAEVVAEVTHALATLFSAGIPVVAYNASYDFSLLMHEAHRHGIEALDDPTPVFDPLVVDKSVDRFRRGKRTLASVAEHYSVELTSAHDAAADAIAAGRIALALADRFADQLPADPVTLHTEQIAWAREQADSLTEYFVRIGRIDASQPIDGSWPIRA